MDHDCSLRLPTWLTGVSLFLVLFHPAGAHAIQISDNVLAHIIAAGSYQAVQASNDEDVDGAALPVQLSFAWKINDKSRVYTKFGFAKGDGVNIDSPFNIDPWGADLEIDVTNINGTSRDYLLTAWYRHTFFRKDDHHFDIAVGLIDGTEYLDRNLLSNNEYTQFMNSVLVNAPNVFIPSYHPGVGMVYRKGNVSARMAYMKLHENLDGNEGQYAAVELDYNVQNRLGLGQYRATLARTDDSYFAADGDGLTHRKAIVFSFDQQLARGLGVFTRFGLQDDDASVDYKSILSGGIQVRGIHWNRIFDTVGIGLARLQDGNQDIESSSVFEAYYRAAMNEHLDITLDVQYMQDRYVDNTDDVDGWILGVRALAHF